MQCMIMSETSSSGRMTALDHSCKLEKVHLQFLS